MCGIGKLARELLALKNNVQQMFNSKFKFIRKMTKIYKDQTIMQIAITSPGRQGKKVLKV